MLQNFGGPASGVTTVVRAVRPWSAPLLLIVVTSLQAPAQPAQKLYWKLWRKLLRKRTPLLQRCYYVLGRVICIRVAVSRQGLADTWTIHECSYKVSIMVSRTYVESLTFSHLDRYPRL